MVAPVPAGAAARLGEVISAIETPDSGTSVGPPNQDMPTIGVDDDVHIDTEPVYIEGPFDRLKGTNHLGPPLRDGVDRDHPSARNQVRSGELPGGALAAHMTLARSCPLGYLGRTHESAAGVHCLRRSGYGQGLSECGHDGPKVGIDGAPRAVFASDVLRERVGNNVDEVAGDNERLLEEVARQQAALISHSTDTALPSRSTMNLLGSSVKHRTNAASSRHRCACRARRLVASHVGHAHT